MTDGFERGRQEARRRHGITSEPNPLDDLAPTGLNAGRLAAIARHGDQEQRRNASSVLRRWETTPPEDDGSNAA